MSYDDQIRFVVGLQDDLEVTERDKRVKAIQGLLYLVQGSNLVMYYSQKMGQISRVFNTKNVIDTEADLNKNRIISSCCCQN